MTATLTHAPTGQAVEIIDAIGGTRAGLNHAGDWCVPVKFPDGSRRFVIEDDLHVVEDGPR